MARELIAQRETAKYRGHMTGCDPGRKEVRWCPRCTPDQFDKYHSTYVIFDKCSCGENLMTGAYSKLCTCGFDALPEYLKGGE